MATILNIAGHGPNRDGSFDPGAKAILSRVSINIMLTLFLRF